MKALVVGYGSIGSRHARLLRGMGCEVGVLSGRAIDFVPHFRTLEEALEAHDPAYLVVANRTADHVPTLERLVALDYRGLVLAEKPLFHHRTLRVDHHFEAFGVAYNLRFYAVVQRLRALLMGQTVLSVQAYAGQYLPTWRPPRPYQQSYSSRKQEGGGVLRDLSHELDYLNWMLGGWTRLAALGGKHSHLEGDSDDLFSLLISFRDCPAVTLHLNYLDRYRRRYVIVNTDQYTVKADLARGRIRVNDALETFEIDWDQTYLEQHRAMMEKNFDVLCSEDEGLAVMRMICAAEHSVAQGCWVSAETLENQQEDSRWIWQEK